ncbi:MAG: hypothetical protein ACYC9L_02930 [Sulfuricaulis sp.]
MSAAKTERSSGRGERTLQIRRETYLPMIAYNRWIEHQRRAGFRVVEYGPSIDKLVELMKSGELFAGLTPARAPRRNRTTARIGTGKNLRLKNEMDLRQEPCI